jgi:hypothetical protein
MLERRRKMKCETTSQGKKCGKNAIAKVTCKWNKKKSFYVCKDCLPAYEFQEYGNTESMYFIIEKLKKEEKNE